MAIEHVVLQAGDLVLRPPDASEAADALTMLQDADVRLWNPAPSVIDLQSSADWCRRGRDWSNGAHATFSILDADAAYIGNVSLFAIDWEQRTASIGYRIARGHRGRGAATSAVRTVSEWAFSSLGLERIQLFHAVDNPASCRVATKAGFLLEGVLRSATAYGDGRRHDEHLHARLASDAT